MNIKGLVVLSALIYVQPYCLLADEKSSGEKIGDFLSIALPASAYGATFVLDDKEGRSQYYRSFATTTAINAALKLSGVAERPHNDKKDSFPSGHTAYAFQGATFIHKRYGLKYGIPAYLGASYVGYNRVDVGKHHSEDVWAGALIGIASSWYFTEKKANIVPIIAKDTLGVSYSKNW